MLEKERTGSGGEELENIIEEMEAKVEELDAQVAQTGPGGAGGMGKPSASSQIGFDKPVLEGRRLQPVQVVRKVDGKENNTAGKENKAAGK